MNPEELEVLIRLSTKHWEGKYLPKHIKNARQCMFMDCKHGYGFFSIFEEKERYIRKERGY